MRLQLAGIRYIHAAKLGLPFVECALADTMTAADFRSHHTALVFRQDRDDLLFREPRLPHVHILLAVTDSTQIWRSLRDIETGASLELREERGGNLLTGRAVSGVQEA